MIKYWFNLISGKMDKLSYKSYKMLLYLHRNNIHSSKWISSIENILQTIGFNYLWIENHVNNVDWLCKEVKERLEC